MAPKINHADLACRNLLLDSALNLKISDFGLSQKGLAYNYGFAIKRNQNQDTNTKSERYQTSALNSLDKDDTDNLLKDKSKDNKGRNFPIWSAAIEVQESEKITNFSDVWSFGVTAWEIFARGLKPNVSIQQLKRNYRLKRPIYCPLATMY